MDRAWACFTSSVFPCAVGEVRTNKVTFEIFTSGLENYFASLDAAIDALSCDYASGFSGECVGGIVIFDGVFLTSG